MAIHGLKNCWSESQNLFKFVSTLVKLVTIFNPAWFNSWDCPNTTDQMTTERHHCENT